MGGGIMKLSVEEGFLYIQDKIIDVRVQEGYKNNYDIDFRLPEESITLRTDKKQLKEIRDKINQALEINK